MSRVIRSAELHPAPVDVPAPPAWDATALSAYEAGHARGVAEGRSDVRAMEQQLRHAVERCIDAVDAASEQLATQVLDIAELFVTSVLRHVPEARTAGMLVRLGEVLRTFDTDPLEVFVAPDDVPDVAEVIAGQPKLAPRVSVVGDPMLLRGEFRLHSAWADAQGTFDRYFAAARDAVERLVVAGGA